MSALRPDDLIAEIDAIAGDDPERAHSQLDELLEMQMPLEVRRAIYRLQSRCSWWACA